MKSIFYGTLASAILLGVYFAILSSVSGWDFAQDQFAQFWYFIVSLAIGFGIQVGLFTYLRQAMKQGMGAGRALAVSGTTSTVAMISCCAHYLVNIAPLIATAGVITFISQYQIQFFWVGLAFNIGGIAYIANKIRQHNQAMP
jgi:Cu+-exporting ATPase